MEIVFSNRIEDKLCDLRLGILEFICKTSKSDPIFWELIENESKKISNNLSSEQITQIPTISHTRIAYKAFGKDPSRYRPSADSLVRRIVKGNELYKVNSIVDVLNLISIQSGFSIGGYDMSKISGGSILDIGNETDEYYGIGRGLLNIKGLPVLRDEIGVYGSPTSDSERTMISDNAKNIVFVFFDFGSSDTLNETIARTKDYLSSYCLASNIIVSIIKL